MTENVSRSLSPCDLILKDTHTHRAKHNELIRCNKNIHVISNRRRRKENFSSLHSVVCREYYILTA
jgi:hypothetical protein